MPHRWHIALFAASLAAALAFTEDLDEGFALSVLIAGLVSGTVAVLGYLGYAAATRSMPTAPAPERAGLRELAIVVVAVVVATTVAAQIDSGAVLAGIVAAVIAAPVAHATSLAFDRVRGGRAP